MQTQTIFSVFVFSFSFQCYFCWRDKKNHAFCTCTCASFIGFVVEKWENRKRKSRQDKGLRCTKRGHAQIDSNTITCHFKMKYFEYFSSSIIFTQFVFFLIFVRNSNRFKSFRLVIGHLATKTEAKEECIFDLEWWCG